MPEYTILQNDRFISYTATAGQTVFPYDFPIFDDDHLEVIQEGVVLTKTTDYTVSGVDVQAGGNVTLVSGATLNDTVVIRGVTPEERTSDFSQAGDFLAATLNRDLDLLVQQTQQLRRDSDKSIRFADDSSTTGITFPEPSASKFIRYNAAADDLETVDISTLGAVAVGTSGAAVGLLNTNNTHSGNNTFSGTNSHSGIETFTNDVVLEDNLNINFAGQSFSNASTDDVIRIAKNGNNIINIQASTTTISGVNFSDTADRDIGAIHYDHATDSMQFRTNNAVQMTIDNAGIMQVEGGVNPNASGGAVLDKYLYASASLNFGTINAGASEDLTITVTGAATGDGVIPHLPAAINSGIVITMFVSAANTVTVRATNASTLAINPSTMTFGATVIGT